jgi:hypothetical protein
LSQDLGIIPPILANDEPISVNSLINDLKEIPKKLSRVVLDSIKPETAEL